MPNMQPTYMQYHPRAQLGMIASTRAPDFVSRINTGANKIPFGRVCGQGTEEDACQLGGTPFAGVSVHQDVLDQLGLTDGTCTADQFCTGATLGLMREGDVWVINDGPAVTPSTVALYNAVDGTVASDGDTAFPGHAIFETAAANGELVRLRIEA